MVTLPILTADAIGAAGTLGEGSTLEMVLLMLAMDSGRGDGPTPLPMPALDAVLATGAAGQADVDLPALTLAATGATGMGATGALTLPMPTVNGNTGSRGDVTLPALALAGTGVSGAALRGELTLPMADLAASGFAHGFGAGDLALPLVALSAIGTSSGVAVGDIVLPLVALNAAGSTGLTGSAMLSVPLLTLDGTGGTESTGTAAILLPMLQLAGTNGATAQAVQALPAPAFAGVVVNTKSRAVTHYSGVSANSLTVFNGLVLAATADGIVALEGDTDLGAAIDAHLTAGVSDLGSEQLKRVIAGYVGYRAEGDMELTLIADDHHEYVYRLEPRRLGDQHASRVKFGRGVDGRYWQWKLANRDGAGFALDSLALDVLPLSKRVR